jgi:hypothetical protein
MSGYNLADALGMDETDPVQMEEAAAKIRLGLQSRGVSGVRE